MADRIKDVHITHYPHYSKIVRSGKWGWAFRKTRKAERENRQMEERDETLEPLKCKFPGQDRKRNKNIHRTKLRDVTHVHWHLHLTCNNNNKEIHLQMKFFLMFLLFSSLQQRMTEPKSKRELMQGTIGLTCTRRFTPYHCHMK